VRALLSAGRAEANEIAITAAACEPWDEHVLALAADTGLRIHFAHGVPALSTRDGQRCAALADVLVRGLSEPRVRRLVGLCTGEGTPLDGLPAGWMRALPRGATLVHLGDWERALRGLTLEGNPIDAETLIVPLLRVLARGPAAAAEVAARTLRGRSQQMWATAIRVAPVHAIELTLRNVRVADECDAGDSVVWCPAAQLAAAPRPWVRLLGLASGAWPRSAAVDPILPGHIVAARDLDPDPLPEADRRCFATLLAADEGGAVLSRSRRSPQGHRLGPSPLLPDAPSERALSRARIPEHAFSEADRLMARPAEAAALPRIQQASACWRNWHVSAMTAHDGQFQTDHPAILRALARTQSPTSLRLLLRGPLGFVWKYALGWYAPAEAEEPLTIAAADFGKLVHER
jgi:hypothetical protein